MRKIFSFYRRFLGTIFVLWLFLSTAGKLGFGFGVNLRLFFRVFFWFILVYLVWETKIRWPVIYPIIKTLFLKARNEFALKTETTKKEIISSSPKIFAGKTVNSLVLVLAIILSLFSFFRQFFKTLRRFVRQPGTLLMFAILGILANIFIFDFASTLMVVLLSTLLIVVIKLNQLKGKVVVAVGLILLVLCPFLLAFKTRPLMVEKVAIWTYVFLAIGTGRMFIGYLKHED